MQVPAKAYVCAYCRKTLRTSPFSVGLAATLGIVFLLILLSKSGEPTKQLARATDPPTPRQPAKALIGAATGLPVLDAATGKAITTEDLQRNLKEEEVRRSSEDVSRESEDAAFRRTSAGKIWQRHPDWDRQLCEVIAKRQIRVGMTDAQVRTAWGKPQSINSTTYASGTHEQWVYGVGQYVYFENGIMTSLQQSR
jgi:hypothetical protein